MFQPIGWVKDSLGDLILYDPSLIIVEGTTLPALVVLEADVYYSLDEVTFVLLVESLNVSFNGGQGANLSAGSQQFVAPHDRCPEGAGLYLKLRSNGTVNTDTVDLKVQIHAYSKGV